MAFERYAIYWAPGPWTELAAFGRAWLGGDPETGTRHQERDCLGLPADLVERATRSPRRYGLHATLKAPFRLAGGVMETELSSALASFCERRRRIFGGPLRLHRFTRYLALVPTAPRADVEWLADECVTCFDRFRAPLTDAERARRSRERSTLERAYLEEFGYSDIFSRFFFHITLAGPLDPDELGRVEAALLPAVATFTEKDFAVEDVCLFGDPGGGALFKILGRWMLTR